MTLQENANLTESSHLFVVASPCNDLFYLPTVSLLTGEIKNINTHTRSKYTPRKKLKNAWIL